MSSATFARQSGQMMDGMEKGAGEGEKGAGEGDKGTAAVPCLPRLSHVLSPPPPHPTIPTTAGAKRPKKRPASSPKRYVESRTSKSCARAMLALCPSTSQSLMSAPQLALVRDFVLDYDRPRAGARQPPQRWIRTRNSIIPEYPSEDDDDDEQEDEEVEHDEAVNDDDDDDSEVVVARRPLRASAAAAAAVPVAPAAPPSHAAGLNEAALLRSPASPSGGAGASARRRSRLAVLRDSILGVLSPTSPAAAIRWARRYRQLHGVEQNFYSQPAPIPPAHYSPMPTLSEVEEEPLRRRRSEASPAPHTTPTITVQTHITKTFCSLSLFSIQPHPPSLPSQIESPEPAPKLTSKFPRPKPAANRRPPSR